MQQGDIEGPRGRLHFARSGRAHAPSLLLLHPLGADLGVWEPVLADLERFFAVLRVDLPGHGDSPAATVPQAEVSIGDFVADVLAVCDALGIRRTHCCGISLGGAIALDLALAWPDRLHRLVLANTAPRFPDTEAWQSRIALVRAQGMTPIVEAMPQRWFSREFLAREPAGIEALARRMQRTCTRSYIEACQALQGFDRLEALAQLRVPTLVLAGATDEVTPVEHIEAWYPQIAGADLRVLDAGHLAVMEQPADFAAALIDFLRE